MQVSIEINKSVKGELINQTIGTFTVADETKVSTVVNKATSKLCAVANLGIKGKYALIKNSAKINILIDGNNILTDEIKGLFSLQSNNYGLSFNTSNPEKFKTDLLSILTQYKIFLEA